MLAQYPRAPRFANSGTGEIGWIEPSQNVEAPGTFQPLAFCPGFVRGLAFHRNFALVGLSKPRYKRFEGLELDDRLREADSEPWCGIQIIDIETGICKHWFRIDGDVAELYDIAVIPNVGCAKSLHTIDVAALNLITIENELGQSAG